MEISHRIHARKVVLSYFYQRCFFLYLQKNKTIAQEMLAFDYVFPDHKDFDNKIQHFMGEIEQISHTESDEDIQYIIQNCFDKWDKEIDMDYVMQIIPKFDEVYTEVAKLVDTHTTTFSFDKMDLIDQALFVLWYAEHSIFHTPKEILLNELIELAKRYADDGSTKLINAIMHKIVN